MNVLWHTWEPALEGNDKTSGGGGAWTSYLWKKFNLSGIYVYYPTTKSDQQLYKSWKPDRTIDAAVFCWRWKLPNAPQYVERNMIYDRQNALIGYCISHKIPFIVHDQDLKMTDEERYWIKECGGIIATPSFYPEHDEISLHFPNPYTTDRLINLERGNHLTYVGNNYERFSQAINIVGGEFSEVIPTYFYGNWNENGPGRNFEQIQKALPHVNFMGRLPQSEIIKVLGDAWSTVMLHKPEYGPRGFTTIRWAEAACAGILPFIPVEFQLPNKYKQLLDPLRVYSSSELLEKHIDFSEDDEMTMITIVRRMVNEYMSAEPWTNLLRRITK